MRLIRSAHVFLAVCLADAQGMDQRAERNVHNQLVEVTCATDAGQYFLITPKLLTGLRYHKNMKVLIVNNGTWCE